MVHESIRKHICAYAGRKHILQAQKQQQQQKVLRGLELPRWRRFRSQTSKDCTTYNTGHAWEPFPPSRTVIDCEPPVRRNPGEAINWRVTLRVTAVLYWLYEYRERGVDVSQVIAPSLYTRCEKKKKEDIQTFSHTRIQSTDVFSENFVRSCAPQKHQKSFGSLAD